VLGSLDLGGSERQAFLLAKHLAEREAADVQLWAWCAGRRGDLARLCEGHGMAWRIVPYQSFDRVDRVLALLRHMAALRRAEPDVILSYLMPPNVVCASVWRGTGAKAFIWNQRNIGQERQGRLIERLAVRMTPCFVANSAQGAAFLIDTLGADAARVHMIRNGVFLDPPQSGRSAWRRKLSLSPECFAACMVANLTAYKDHATLIKAWRRLVKRWPDASKPHLVLAGYPGDAAEGLNQLVGQLGLAKLIHFPGHVQDVAGLLSAMDLGVFSSRSEGSPNGVLECMAGGLAVAGTDIPGVREAVGPDGEAWLAPVADAASLAERIFVLARDAGRRAEIGRANRARIARHFSAEQMTEQMTQLILAGLAAR